MTDALKRIKPIDERSSVEPFRKIITMAYRNGTSAVFKFCKFGELDEESCLEKRCDGCWCEGFERWRTGKPIDFTEWQRRYKGEPQRCAKHADETPLYCEQFSDGWIIDNESEDFYDDYEHTNDACWHCVCERERRLADERKPADAKP